MSKRIVAAAAVAVAAAAAATIMAVGAAAGPDPVSAGHELPTVRLAGAPSAGTPAPDSAAAPSRAVLTGKVIGIDPGHNGLNYTDPSYINRQVWNGRQPEACDTTGTATNGGYTEARFTFRVARFLRADLLRAGARVVMTRTDNHGVGPCITRRARMLNHAHAVVSVDIHGDGGPAWGRGFSILEPVRDGPNNRVIRPSRRLGRDIRSALLARTSMPVSNYYGHNGIALRNDLAGLNLTTEPKVLIECGNMRNRADARLMTSAAFQKRLARALEAAIIRYLSGR